MYANRSPLFVVVGVIGDQRLNIAVENKPHDFEVFVDHWRTGISTNNVSGAYEIHFGLARDLFLSRLPRFRQHEILLPLSGSFMSKRAVNVSKSRDRFAFFLVAHDGAKSEPKRKGRIGVDRIAIGFEQYLGDLCIRLLVDFADFVRFLPLSANLFVQRQYELDQRIFRRFDCRHSASSDLLSYFWIIQLGTVNQLGSSFDRVLTRKDLLTNLAVRSVQLTHACNPISEQYLFQFFVDRSGRKELLLQRVAARLLILGKSFGGGFLILNRHLYKRLCDVEHASSDLDTSTK